MGGVAVASLAWISVLLSSASPAQATNQVWWLTDGDGLWTDASNWSSDPSLPGSGDHVIIDRTAAPDRPSSGYLVELADGWHMLESLLLQERLRVFSDATLEITDEASINNTVTLDGGTLIGGRWDLSMGLLEVSSSSRIVGASVEGDIVAARLQLLHLEDTQVDGTIFLDEWTGLVFDASQTFAQGTIDFGGEGWESPVSVFMSAPGALTLGADVTVRGGSGVLGHARRAAPQAPMELVNHGLILVEPGHRIEIEAEDGFINHGTVRIEDGGVAQIRGHWTSSAGRLELHGGRLELRGEVTTEQFGTLDSDGGEVHLVLGTLDNTGATLPLDEWGTWRLFRSDIHGGLIQGGTDQHGRLEVQTAGTLSDVTVNADIDLLPSQAELRIDQAVIDGTINVQGGQSTVAFEGDHELEATGIVFSGSLSGVGLLDAGGRLTLGEQALVRGEADFVRIGQPDFRYGAMELINHGTIETTRHMAINPIDGFVNHGVVRVIDGTMHVATPWSNATGVFEVAGGRLLLGNVFTIADIGTIHRLGGDVAVRGTLDNTGTVLPLDEWGTWRLVVDGEIRGGEVRTGGGSGAVLEVERGRLENVALHGDAVVTRALHVDNVALDGTIHVGTISGRILFGGTQTFESGTIHLDVDAQDHPIVIGMGEAGTLTLGPDVVVRGGDALIGQRIGHPTEPMELINHGLIIADHPGRHFEINASDGLTNHGALRVAGGTMTLNTDWSSDDGTIELVDGTLRLGGTPRTLDLDALFRSGGMLELIGTLDNNNAAVELDAIGRVRLDGGTIEGGTIESSASDNHLRATANQANHLAHTLVAADIILDGEDQQLGLEAVELRGATTLSGRGSRLALTGDHELPGVIRLAHPEAGVTAGDASASPVVLTVSEDGLIHGRGRIGAPGGTPISLVNHGLVRAEYGELTVAASLINHANVDAVDAILTLNGELANLGTIRATNSVLTLGNTTGIEQLGALHLDGTTVNLNAMQIASGTIHFEADRSVVRMLEPATLTLGEDVAIRGGEALIGHNEAPEADPAMNLINRGAIIADVASKTIAIDPIDGLINEGRLEARDSGQLVAHHLSNLNFHGNILTGGEYIVGPGSRLTLAGAAISRNVATIELAGSDSELVDELGNDVLSGLRHNEGSLTIRDGRSLSVPYVFYNRGDLLVGSDSTLIVNDDLHGVGPASTLTIGPQAQVTVNGWTNFWPDGVQLAFDNGVLTTQTLAAPWDRMTGSGAIHTRGLIADGDVVFERPEDLQQQLLLDALPGQAVTITLDIDGTGALGVGSGSLTIRGGQRVDSTLGIIGYGGAAEGQGLVTGEGSQWASAGELTVGAGVLTVEKGGQVFSHGGRIVSFAEATARIVGSGSTWISSDSVVVGSGQIGHSALVVADGAMVEIENGLSIRPGGQLMGDGLVRAPVVQTSGQVLPGLLLDADAGAGAQAGTLYLDGDYVQAAARPFFDRGLTILVDGQAHGQLVITGEATLHDSRLEIHVIEGSRPAYWQAMPILTADSVTGTFFDQLVSNVDADTAFLVDYGADTIWLTAALRGDMAMSGTVDTGDVAPFVLALTDPEAYMAQFGINEATMTAVADINQDGVFDSGDVAPFVQLLVGGGSQSVPEPNTLALLGLGALTLLRRRRSFAGTYAAARAQNARLTNPRARVASAMQ